jgi:hypothetical protein
MTAELAAQAKAALGDLLVGLAMTATRFFIDLVKKETQIEAYLPINKAGAIVRDSPLVMLLPAATALLIVVSAPTTSRWTVMLDVLLYLSRL